MSAFLNNFNDYFFAYKCNKIPGCLSSLPSGQAGEAQAGSESVGGG